MLEFFTGPRYTEDELNARLKFFIGIILGLTLFGIVFVVLYSLIFVTQPMNGMSPVDNKFFELIIPIATFLVGTLSGIMLAGGDKDLRAKALDAANKPPPPSAPPAPALGASRFGGASSGFAGGVAAGFGAGVASTGFGSQFVPQEPTFNYAEVVTGFGGKPAPVQAPQPEI
jgi:hypothetical protein